MMLAVPAVKLPECHSAYITVHVWNNHILFILCNLVLLEQEER